MASVRKKQSSSSENNLKILRELVSLPCNKHCFDCNQRGPTYVNVTIGSFVCTKCSGMLRGLTPPHRVKSISMATFVTEEVDLLKVRGNDYCRSTWLGLYEGSLTTETKDEQIIKDFMIDKYERKRYLISNVPNPSQVVQRNEKPSTQRNSNDVKPLLTLGGNNKPRSLKIQNGNNKPSPNNQDSLILDSNRIKSMFPTVNLSKNNSADSTAKFNSFTPDNNPDFVADFGTADIFSSSQVNNNSTSQQSFANFENNPIFNSTGMPTPTALNNMQNSATSSTVVQAPSEDRYAALKDLDMALKQQSHEPNVDWNVASSTGSSYGSPTPSGSLYGSPSPASSIYSSPSQDQFAAVFGKQEQPIISNPFSTNNSPWAMNGNGVENGTHNASSNIFNQNPFRSADNINGKMNGALNGFTSSQLSNINGKQWGAPNPFTIGASPATVSHPSNPFL